jgi:hypothetical protein
LVDIVLTPALRVPGPVSPRRGYGDPGACRGVSAPQPEPYRQAQLSPAQSVAELQCWEREGSPCRRLHQAPLATHLISSSATAPIAANELSAALNAIYLTSARVGSQASCSLQEGTALAGAACADMAANLLRARMQGLLRACKPRSLVGDGGLDRGGDLYDQGHSCGRAQVQGGARLVGKHQFCRYYRLGGAVGCGLHPAALSIRNVACTVVRTPTYNRSLLLNTRLPCTRCKSTSPTRGVVLSESCLPTRSSTTAIRCRPAFRRCGASWRSSNRWHPRHHRPECC